MAATDHGLIALDWGTSSLRAYRLAAAGRVADTRARPWGIRRLPAGGFDAVLAEVTAGWPALPRLASGMVGSRNGWREVPYLELPSTAAAIAAGLAVFNATDGRALHVVPGLRDPRGPDVMRGEETQIVGALAMRPISAASATFLLPGTHSKWVRVRDGVVTDFRTTMTGELYALLLEHSILGVGDIPARDDPAAFARGVCRARDSGAAGITPQLFSARTLLLDGVLAAAAVPDYLSGLLLGEEFRALRAEGDYLIDGPIQLIGDPALCARYRTAGALFGLSFEEPLADAAAHGLWRIACLAGLVGLPLEERPAC